MSSEFIDPRVLEARRRLDDAQRCQMVDVNLLVGTTAPKLEVPVERIQEAVQDIVMNYPTLSQEEVNQDYFIEGMTEHSQLFPALDSYSLEGEKEDQGYQRGAQRILNALSERHAATISERMQAVVQGLREPVKTVAVNHFYRGLDQVVIAENLNTSVETVEFLAQTALDQLELHIDINIR